MEKITYGAGSKDAIKNFQQTIQRSKSQKKARAEAKTKAKPKPKNQNPKPKPEKNLDITFVMK